MGQMGFCKILRFPAVFCEDLRLRNAVIPRRSENQHNLQKRTANSAPFVRFSLSLLLPLELIPKDPPKSYVIILSPVVLLVAQHFEQGLEIGNLEYINPLSGADATPPPRLAPGCSYSAVAATPPPPVTQRAPGLKKINLEGQYWKNQAFNTEWNFQSSVKFSNREWNFQARMKISCAGPFGLFTHSSENEFFRSPGPLGKGPVAPHPGPPYRPWVVWTSETLSSFRGWSSYTCECRAALWHYVTPLGRNKYTSDIFWTRVWCIPGFGAENKSALFEDFLLISAVLRVWGRSQNPRQTPVCTKLRLKRFPNTRSSRRCDHESLCTWCTHHAFNLWRECNWAKEDFLLFPAQGI